MKEIYCKNAGETERLGQILGQYAKSGDVFCLTGTLGAGKTLMSRGIAEGLGVADEEINSPTFALMNVYSGKMEVRHFDLYRLNHEEELYDIGFYEYCGGDGLSLVEWGELFLSELPDEYLHIVIELEPVGRKVTLQPLGKRYEELCEEVIRNVDFGN